MNRIKCSGCGLVNGPSEITCGRCGAETGKRKAAKGPRSPREAAKKSSWIYTILFLALLASAATYLFKGVEKSYDQEKAVELNRAAAQSNKPGQEPKSRTEFEQKQTGAYKNAIQNSPGLGESRKHLDEVNKLMRPEKDRANN